MNSRVLLFFHPSSFRLILAILRGSVLIEKLNLVGTEMEILISTAEYLQLPTLKNELDYISSNQNQEISRLQKTILEKQNRIKDLKIKIQEKEDEAEVALEFMRDMKEKPCNLFECSYRCGSKTLVRGWVESC